MIRDIVSYFEKSFNTQPPEGGWLGVDKEKLKKALVSTHSRLKAAGYSWIARLRSGNVSTHSRLKAAGKEETEERNQYGVSTHSRLKAAGYSLGFIGG